MRYQEIKPCEALQRIVRYFWIIEQDSCHPGTTARYRLFAESSPSIVFFHTHEQCFLAGQTISSRETLIPGKFLMVGACLYPYTVPLLFGLPAGELTNTAFDFESVAGREARILKERVIEAQGLAEKLQILTDYFLHKLNNISVIKRSIQGCVQEIVQSGGQIAVPEIVDQLGISPRQAERKFQEYVGFSPKLFSRLIRFHTSLKFSGANHSLTDIAYRSGYFDQSHFIREFREFSGVNPKLYFRLNSAHMADNFIRLPD